MREAHTIAYEPRLAAAPQRFVFGGVGYELYLRGLEWMLTDEDLLLFGPGSGDAVARVHCVVAAAPELQLERSREISWRWSGPTCQVRAGRARAELRDIGQGRFAASALMAPDATGSAALATALTTCVVTRLGGFCLHAAAIELDGRAVLFLGPSGAGKTTAANHCRGARVLARDRVVVYPTARGWFAAGLTGGEASLLPSAEPRALPLGAVLRVVRRRETGVSDLSGSAGLAALRESIQSPASSSSEQELLRRALELSASTYVGQAAVVLGEDLSPHCQELLDV